MERYEANRIFPSSLSGMGGTFSGGAFPLSASPVAASPPSSALPLPPLGVEDKGVDFPDISEMVDAIEKSKRAFDHLAAHGSMLPTDFLALHRLFEEARCACDAVIATIEKTTAAGGHRQEPAHAR